MKERNLTDTTKGSCLEIDQYPPEQLRILGDGVSVSVTYKKTWEDGFGARGWKLDAAIGDDNIIASTRETGQKIVTSVFIHDILDHFLSGFNVSGHRSEAMALIQLFKRTGSDPRADYEQMVKEDIENGRVNGETMISFLPESLRSLLPTDTAMTDKEIINCLKNTVDKMQLRDVLIEHFFTLGQSGTEHAIKSWKKLGLDPEKSSQIGLALQDILNRVDRIVEESGVEALEATIVISNESCVLNIQNAWFAESVYTAHVA